MPVGPRLWIRRRETFCAAHRLYDPLQSDAENHTSYGMCAALHGHNYVLTASVSGPVNEKTGMIVSFDDLKGAMGQVIGRFDHTNLNDHPFFKDRLTTVEHFIQLLWTQLEEALAYPAQLEQLELFETEKNSVVLTRSAS